jgi:hypothetical protein
VVSAPLKSQPKRCRPPPSASSSSSSSSAGAKARKLVKSEPGLGPMSGSAASNRLSQ